MTYNVLRSRKYCHYNTHSITNFDISQQSESLLTTFWKHLTHLFEPIYNQTETIIINTKSIKISIHYADIIILIITNHKFMIWNYINDPNYTLNNIIKFCITPEKHCQHKQLIYHLFLLQISKLYWIHLKLQQLQLFVLLQVLFVFILPLILNIHLNVQYILYYMIYKINIIYINPVNYRCMYYFLL